jgi:acetylornithine deacetylase
VPHLLSHLDHLPKPAFAVIGEPTEMKVVTSHKGMLSFETTVTGHEWHSSQPHYGVNAVQIAADLVHFLTGMAQELSGSGLTDKRFDPPSSTIHVGVIQGGTARNIIPRECKFLWEIRPVPGENPKTIMSRFEEHCKKHLGAMHNVSKDTGIATRAITSVGAVTLPAEAEALCQKVMRAAKTNAEQAVSFFTEGGAFQSHGIPAIVCGPGNIKQAHQPNEFIDVAQIKTCVEFLLRLTGEP